MRRAAVGPAVLTVIAIAVSSSAMPPAHAATARGGFGGAAPVLGVGLLVSTAGITGDGRATYRADDPTAPRPVFTRAVPAESGGGAGGLSNLCFAPDGLQGPAFKLGNGWIFSIELFDRI